MAFASHCCANVTSPLLFLCSDRGPLTFYGDFVSGTSSQLLRLPFFYRLFCGGCEVEYIIVLENFCSCFDVHLDRNCSTRGICVKYSGMPIIHAPYYTYIAQFGERSTPVVESATEHRGSAFVGLAPISINFRP